MCLLLTPSKSVLFIPPVFSSYIRSTQCSIWASRSATSHGVRKSIYKPWSCRAFPLLCQPTPISFTSRLIDGTVIYPENNSLVDTNERLSNLLGPIPCLMSVCLLVTNRSEREAGPEASSLAYIRHCDQLHLPLRSMDNPDCPCVAGGFPGSGSLYTSCSSSSWELFCEWGSLWRKCLQIRFHEKGHATSTNCKIIIVEPCF